VRLDSSAVAAAFRKQPASGLWSRPSRDDAVVSVGNRVVNASWVCENRLRHYGMRLRSANADLRRRPGIHTPRAWLWIRARSFHSRPGMTIPNTWQVHWRSRYAQARNMQFAPPAAIAARVDAIDWGQATGDLDAQAVPS